MEIKSFRDLIEEMRMPEQILQGIEERLRMGARGVEFQFTDLQKKAFNNEKYWYSRSGEPAPAHVLVQGATSSGKTLVSEMSVIECLCAKPKKKAIILVPLKAMVRERRDHFADDLPDERVYASSSDFQDHDADIINGNYDVAVIVYEKFFAMLSQPSNQILNDCALLVVDELQMLSSEGRGPKLEISIQKVMRHNAELGTDNPLGTYTRIMCLTTCDCKVDNIRRWLTVEKKEPLTIRSESRPVGLEEYVLQVNGERKGLYMQGERDPKEAAEQFDPDPEPLEIEEYDKNHRPEIAKRLALRALLRKVYGENPKAKVLVFVSDRKKTRDIAEYISRENILPYQPLSSEIRDELAMYDTDESQDMLEKLLPYGIAFHNSALSSALREYVEKAFEKNEEDLPEGFPEIRLVVATETLTIGMNMPVDVMILYDARVPRGKEVPEKLTSQEYKNFVGRAGRLGQSNRIGQSYILALDKGEAATYWDDYVNCRKQDINSALLVAKEDVQAPYYLSLLSTGKKYRIRNLEELQSVSFSQQCGGHRIGMEKMMRELKKASLCTRREILSIFEDEDDEEDLTAAEGGKLYEYEVGELGQMFAPYALSLETCKLLRRYFLDGGYRKYKTGRYEERLQDGEGGIPEQITAEEIDNDRYLLDILYTLCRSKEIANLSQFRIPTGDNARIAKNIIWDKLKEMVSPHHDSDEPLCELWPESHLQYILDGRSDHETEELQAVMRAILLWHWTKGKKIREIRTETGFMKFLPSLFSGDLARLAEIVSYQLDAVYRCAAYFRNIKVQYDDRGPAALYALSTRVNYGMPRNLVIIANRHFYGMDRLTVLKIGEAAKKYKYDIPVRFLEKASPEELRGIITEQQRNELLAMIDRIYLRDDLESLLISIQRNPKSVPISSVESNALRQLYDLKDGEEGTSLGLLKELFWSVDEMESGIRRFFEQSVVLTQKGKTGTVFDVAFGRDSVMTIGEYTDAESTAAIRWIFASAPSHNKNLLLVRDRNILKDISYDAVSGKYSLRSEKNGELIGGIDLAMTYQSLAVLIAQAMALDDRSCRILSGFLFDTEGVFSPKGIKSLYYLLKNYDAEGIHGAKGDAVRVLCDYRNGIEQESCDKLLAELGHRNIPFRILSWGASLEKEGAKDAPTILYITRESFASKSVEHFYEKLRQHSFGTACALFEEEEQFLSLSGDETHPVYGLRHYSGKSPVEKGQYVDLWFRRQKLKKDGLDSYLIGVSYSHTRENGETRPAVRQLEEIIRRLNDVFGEDMIVWDKNESFRDLFDRSGAVAASLALYKKCEYFIILDDRHYRDGENCPREVDVIRECLEKDPVKYNRKVWYLRPKNDPGSDLIREEEDFSRMLDGTEENLQDITGEIVRVVNASMGK